MSAFILTQLHTCKTYLWICLHSEVHPKTGGQGLQNLNLEGIIIQADFFLEDWESQVKPNQQASTTSFTFSKFSCWHAEDMIVNWKKCTLKGENYVLLAEKAEDLSSRHILSDSSERFLCRGKEGTSIYMNSCNQGWVVGT